MIISVWRYSHLALAVSSFILLTIAAATGIILAFEPVMEKSKGFRAEGFEQVTLNKAIPALKEKYPKIQELAVDDNDYVIMSYTNKEGNDAKAYIHPITGAILGTPQKKLSIFEWATDLHRSLFLHEAGRLIMGIASFFLTLIAVSGTILIIQRQRGLKRFFAPIEKTGFAQYYHAVFGRFSLLFIIAIAFTGTYLSVSRFIIQPKKVNAKVDVDKIKDAPEKKLAEFATFQQTKLADVQTIQFPFSDFPEDYYTLKLKDKEVCINQFTGDVLAESIYSKTYTFNNWNLRWHTGRSNMVWAVILAIASAYILFFIYSGFVVMFLRKANTVKNKFKADESSIIILVGSENGSTYKFASAVYKQLLKHGKKVYLTDMDKYNLFQKAEQLIVMASTYGLGDPPSNAQYFAERLNKFQQTQPVQFSVVGFGSRSYTDFCQFAYDADALLKQQSWALQQLEVKTVDYKSPQDFSDWLTAWNKTNGLSLVMPRELLQANKEGLIKMQVTEKTATDNDGAFLIKLKVWNSKRFVSGDLLAIYPKNDHRERLYSVGKVDKQIHLSIKLYEHGLGSNFLHDLKEGNSIKAKIIKNQHFHFPKHAKQVIMISNGTGIAPFLGMLDENKKQVACQLYCGFRTQSSLALYEKILAESKANNLLQSLHVALSREGKKQYVSDLLRTDSEFIYESLEAEAIIMVCGSLSMQKDVLVLLDNICKVNGKEGIVYYQQKGQLLTDCY